MVNLLVVEESRVALSTAKENIYHKQWLNTDEAIWLNRLLKELPYSRKVLRGESFAN